MASELNPYSPPTSPGPDSLVNYIGPPGVRCTKEGLLYRKIEFTTPFSATLEYSGVNFRQLVKVNSKPVWRRMTWVWFEKQIEFTTPPTDAHDPCLWRLSVDIGRGLRFLLFRIEVDGELLFEEKRLRG